MCQKITHIINKDTHYKKLYDVKIICWYKKQNEGFCTCTLYLAAKTSFTMTKLISADALLCKTPPIEDISSSTLTYMCTDSKGWKFNLKIIGCPEMVLQ